jgi:hypothetical protein
MLGYDFSLGELMRLHRVTLEVEKLLPGVHNSHDWATPNEGTKFRDGMVHVS